MNEIICEYVELKYAADEDGRCGNSAVVVFNLQGLHPLACCKEHALLIVEQRIQAQRRRFAAVVGEGSETSNAIYWLTVTEELSSIREAVMKLLSIKEALEHGKPLP